MTLLIACILVYNFQLSSWWYVASVVIFVGEFFLKDYMGGFLALGRGQLLEDALVKQMKRIFVGSSLEELNSRVEALEAKLKK